MTTTTPTKNIRLTITVTPEVHATFTKFAKAAGMPVGRAMGEWLGDTAEAAEFTAQKLAEAREAPALVVRQMHAYALGLADETQTMIEKVRLMGEVGRKLGPGGTAAGPLSPNPPPSNTGGKGQENNSKLSMPAKALAPISRKKSISPKGGERVIHRAEVQAYADNNGFPPKGL